MIHEHVDEIVSFKQTAGVLEEPRFLRTTIVVELVSGGRLSLGGVARWRASSVVAHIQKLRDDFFAATALLQERSSEVRTLGHWISESFSGMHWVAHHRVEAATSTTASLEPVLAIPADYLTANVELARAAEHIHRFHQAPLLFREQANAAFIEAELERWREYFDAVEKNPLTPAQRRAVITHEDHTRVIAGAGSGKTSVIVAKAGYLLKSGLCRPEQLVLVAFNRAAAEEMSARLRDRVGLEVNTTTFHALGLGIIGQVTGKKPTLAKSADDRQLLLRETRKRLLGLLDVPETAGVIRTYFQSFFAPYRSASDFEQLGDYYAYLHAQDIRTIRDEKVKSFEEAEIANFLFLNGVAYEYERNYEFDLADATRRQYQPDFYLPDHEIYIEHFGIDRKGHTAPYIDRTTYNESMAWKVRVHKTHGTRLLQTYSYMKQEGRLTGELHAMLVDAGVALRPISSEELAKVLDERKLIDPFSNLLVTFLRHFKANRHSHASVMAAAGQRQEFTARLEAFLQVFEPVNAQYEAELRAHNAIDFEDMILLAASYAEAGAYESPYACILVDELQDMSVGQSRLLKGLQRQAVGNRLFCVGDDWQAIYRFAGSDIALMRDFDQGFGASETVFLDRTFRFNDRIEAVASRFTQENPAQIKKTIRAEKTEVGPRVTVHRPTGKGDDVFSGAIEEICSIAGQGMHSVLVLGRYKFNRDEVPWPELRQRFPHLNVTFSTVHAAKGTEADFVIVLGLCAGKYGFPSEVEDDPILDVVLSQPELFEHGEERRLFYVALTRARHAVHLLVDHAAPSRFVAEISSYDGLVNARGAASAVPVYCPECNTGTLLQRSGKHGVFFSCSHFPRCSGKMQLCTRCRAGMLIPENAMTLRCNDPKCRYTVRKCPRCKTGRLVERNGTYGQFWGCSNYTTGSCRYTQKR